MLEAVWRQYPPSTAVGYHRLGGGCCRYVYGHSRPAADEDSANTCCSETAINSLENEPTKTGTLLRQFTPGSTRLNEPGHTVLRNQSNDDFLYLC